jgi:hypothetical protein
MYFELMLMYATPASEETMCTVEPTFSAQGFPQLSVQIHAPKETLNGGFPEFNSTANKTT